MTFKHLAPKEKNQSNILKIQMFCFLLSPPCIIPFKVILGCLGGFFFFSFRTLHFLVQLLTVFPLKSFISSPFHSRVYIPSFVFFYQSIYFTVVMSSLSSLPVMWKCCVVHQSLQNRVNINLMLLQFSISVFPVDW